MSEFILGTIGWFGAWMITWPWLLACVVLATLCDHTEESGWEFVFGLMGAFVVFHLFDLSWSEVGIIALCYIPVGMVWSYYRWKRHCNDVVQQVKNNKLSLSDNPYTISDKLDLRKNTDTIVFWIMFWPYSIIANLIGDIYDALCTLVTTRLASVYCKISDNATQQIEDYTNVAQGAGPIDTIGVIAALGGPDNIAFIDHCMTRVRLNVNTCDVFDHDALDVNPAIIAVEITGIHNVQLTCQRPDLIAKALTAYLATTKN